MSLVLTCNMLVSLSGEQLGYFRYDSADGAIGWYDENGNSAARTLIRTPISGARLSSSFGIRRHPVNGFNAMRIKVSILRLLEALPSLPPVLE